MKTILALSLAIAFSASAHATETKLSGPAIIAALTDKTLYGTTNSQPTEQLFQKSGATYSSTGGNQSQGAWRVDGDQYCSQWLPNPSWACYDVMQDGNAIAFIARDGHRTTMSLTK